MRRRALLGSLSAGLAALAGCGYRPGGGEIRWREGVYPRLDGVAVAGGRLLALTREARRFDFEREAWVEGGLVSAMDPASGETVAEVGCVEPARTATLGPDGTVYVWRADGVLRADLASDEEGADSPATSTGVDGWTADLGMEPTTDLGVTPAADAGVSSLVADSRVYAGGHDGLVALDPADGSEAWRWGGATVTGLVAGGGDTAVYALADDRLLAFAGGGSVRWTAPVRGPAGDSPVALVGSNGPALVDGSGVRAFTHGGRRRWVRELGGPRVAPAFADGRLYHAADDGVVRALRPDGRTAWRVDPPVPLGSPLAAAAGRLYVLTGTDLVRLDGSGVVWEADLGVPGPMRPTFGPFAVGNSVLVASESEVRALWRSQLPSARR